QAQVALAVALARHPRLLILDEPVAELDPLARHDFMSTLMEAVAADGVSVVFSSHVLSELERVCDYLVLLSGGSVQIAGTVDDLVASHRVITGPVDQADAVASAVAVVHERRAGRLAVLGGLGLFMLFNGLAMHHAYTRLGLDTCGNLGGPGCQSQLTAFQQDYFSWADHLPHLVMLLPGLIGVFVGAPLVAREL